MGKMSLGGILQTLIVAGIIGLFGFAWDFSGRMVKVEGKLEMILDGNGPMSKESRQTFLEIRDGMQQLRESVEGVKRELKEGQNQMIQLMVDQAQLDRARRER